MALDHLGKWQELFPSSQGPTIRRRGMSFHLGPVSKSSYFLGDPPPDPRFLASLGALSLVELDHFSVLKY
jgi:hypothetical protein